VVFFSYYFKQSIKIKFTKGKINIIFSEKSEKIVLTHNVKKFLDILKSSKHNAVAYIAVVA
jgi:hypothetical protein